MSAVRVATRASLLARTQSGLVADALRERLDREVVLVEVSTQGDVDQTTPLASFGGVGRVRLGACATPCSRGDADVAVHSLKDLPTAPADGSAPRRGASARGRARRARRPRRRHGRRRFLPARRSAPVRRAARPSCARCAPTSTSCRSAATSTPACARSPTASSTPSSSPMPVSPGSAASTRSPRSSRPTRCCPHPDRVRWRSSAATSSRRRRAARRAPRPRRRRRPASPSPRSDPSSPPSRPVARRLSAPTPPSSGDPGEDGSCTCRSRRQRRRPSRCGSRSPGAAGDAERVGRSLAADLLAAGAPGLVNGARP